MLQVRPATADRRALNALNNRTAQIIQAGSYAARVDMARAKWRLLKRPQWLIALRRKLAESCHGIERCMYCEDSYADEIEHLRPKSLYPDETFSWENWLYACGECNGANVKGDRYAVISQGQCVEVSRRKNAPVIPPQNGMDALLNLRAENPLDFIWLDFGTFRFIPIDNDDLASERYLRAEWTIRHLCLNSRSRLVRARRNAYGKFRALLSEYASWKPNVTNALIAEKQQILMETDNRTVWEEMKRQHTMHPELQALFTAAPEALGW